MEDEFHLSMPSIEVSYLLLHIKGAKIRYSGSPWQGPDGLDESALFGIIDQMIELSTLSIPMTCAVTTNSSVVFSSICSRPSCA